MQLLGVEFTDYACFKKRFVPIRQGVQILVGKNNAGKTAILRGLGALSGLPFVMSPKVEARLDGYCPSGGTFLSFGLNVWIAASPEVWPLIAVDHKQPPFYDPANSKLVYQFRVLPQQNTVGLLSVILRTAAKEVEIVQRDGTGNYLLHRMDPNGIVHHNEQVRLLANRGAVGDLEASQYCLSPRCSRNCCLSPMSSGLKQDDLPDPIFKPRKSGYYQQMPRVLRPTS